MPLSFWGPSGIIFICPIHSTLKVSKLFLGSLFLISSQSQNVYARSHAVSL